MADTNNARQQTNILSECALKCVNVILSSRLSQALAGPASSQAQKRNRWFQLELDDSPAVRSSLEQACRADPTTPVEVEVYCCPAGRPEVVLVERWRICLDSSWPMQPYGAPAPFPRMAGSSSSSSGGSTGGRLAGEDGALYKRLTLMVRTLCCHLRVLPTHRLPRAFKKQPIAVWRLTCRVVLGATSLVCPPNATLPPPSAMGPAAGGSGTGPGQPYPLGCRWSCPPVPALGGGFRLGVEHVAPDVVAALEAAAASSPAPPAPLKLIINDYVDTASSPMPTQPQGRPPLPSTPPTTKGLSIPQPPHMRGAGRHGQEGMEGASPGPGGTHASTPTGPSGSSSRNNSLPNRASHSPVVRQSWGRKAQGTLLPPSPPLPTLAALSPPHTVALGEHEATAASAAEAGGASTGPAPAAAQSQAPGTAEQQAQPEAAQGAPVGPSKGAQQPAGRSISTPADVTMAAASMAAASGRGPDGAPGAPLSGAATSAPVLIPGGQPRVRSYADMQIVYNFPDNPHNPSLGPTAHRGRPLASSTSNAGTLVAHTHGSAPAAPRGMLGQALEAHLASLKAMASSTAQPAAAVAPSAPAPAASLRASGDEEEEAAGRQGSGQVASSFGSGSGGGQLVPQQPHLLAVPMPRGPHVGGGHQQASRGRQQGSWRGLMAPDSPQLPFAFTPAAHSLGGSNPANLAGRFPGALSIPPSPSWNSLRTPTSTSHHTPAAWQGPARSGSAAIGSLPTPAATAAAAAGGAAGGAAGSSSTVIITGRDVSALALARRPSWIEHSTRVGRSSSTSGEPSPSADPHSLGGRRMGHGAGSGSAAAMVPMGSSFQPAAGLHTRLSGSPSPGAAQLLASAGLEAPASPGPLPAVLPQPPAQPGAASWLQPPRITTQLSAASVHAMWGEEARGGLASPAWASSVSPPDLPPLMLVTVPVPSQDTDPWAAGLDGAEPEEEDLPFLLDSADEVPLALPLQQQPGQQQQQEGAGPCYGGKPCTSWVKALRPLCSAAATSGQVAAPLGAVPALQGGLRLPSRDVAVGMLLAHLQSSSSPTALNPLPTAAASPAATSSQASPVLTTDLPDAAVADSPSDSYPGGAGPCKPPAAGDAAPGDQVHVFEHAAVAGAHPAESRAGLTCGAALEQLTQLQQQLDALLCFPAAM